MGNKNASTSILFFLEIFVNNFMYFVLSFLAKIDNGVLWFSDGVQTRTDPCAAGDGTFCTNQEAGKATIPPRDCSTARLVQVVLDFLCAVNAVQDVM